MSNRMPSLLALLGLAAAAGYQNRDAIKSMLDRTLSDRTVGSNQDRIAQSLEAGSDDLRPGSRLVGASAGLAAGLIGTLQTGLAELVDRFTSVGDDRTAQSWVGQGQNIAVTPDQLRGLLGAEVIGDLTRKTGLSEIDLLARLAQVLPDTVDHLTPDGVLPKQSGAGSLPVSPLGQY